MRLNFRVRTAAGLMGSYHLTSVRKLMPLFITATFISMNQASRWWGKPLHRSPPRQVNRSIATTSPFATARRICLW